MSDNTKQCIVAVMTNVASVLCCTALAIYFRSWWIILIAFLLYQEVGEKREAQKEGNTDGSKEDTR